MKTSTQKKAVVEERDDAGWREFPTFEQLLTTEAPVPLLAKVEKTCRQLNDLIQAGSVTDKSRARLALTAYGRSLDLLRLLTDIRDRSLQAK